MNPETEQLMGTLELLINEEPHIGFPGDEDSGSIYPFLWEESKQGTFNLFDLCLGQGLFNLTDVDMILESWKKLEYPRHFNDFSLSEQQIKDWEEKIESLEHIISSDLVALECYFWKRSDLGEPPGIIIGQTKDKDWVAMTTTVYVETEIPQEIISRSSLHQPEITRFSGANTEELDAQIKACIQGLGSIAMSGDFGGGYPYSFTYQLVYTIAETKELVIKQVLQKANILKIAKFNGLYRDKTDFKESFYADHKINKFIKQKIEEVLMYRFSSWTEEDIYIVGEVNQQDYLGFSIKSSFAYNP